MAMNYLGLLKQKRVGHGSNVNEHGNHDLDFRMPFFLEAHAVQRRSWHSFP